MSTLREITTSRATQSQIRYIDILRDQLEVSGPSVADLDVVTASAEIDRLKIIEADQRARYREAFEAEMATYQARVIERQAQAAADAEQREQVLADPAYQAWASEKRGVEFSEISRFAHRKLVKQWIAEQPAADETVVEVEQCAAITRKGKRCSRRGHHDGMCWQHGRIRDRAAQESDVITVAGLAREYRMTVEDMASALGEPGLAGSDGVDAEQAREILASV